MMETHSGTKKPGRYDCPACGQRIRRPRVQGTFFRPTYHCPHCGVRISITFNKLFAFLYLLLAAILAAENLWKHRPQWANVLLIIASLALCAAFIVSLVGLLAVGAYRLMPEE
jgi:DNA-directed RNA polymerase subunit RPC12/RpoP